MPSALAQSSALKLHIADLPYYGTSGPLLLLLAAYDITVDAYKYNSDAWPLVQDKLMLIAPDPNDNLPIIQDDSQLIFNTVPCLHYITRKYLLLKDLSLENEQKLESVTNVWNTWNCAFNRKLNQELSSGVDRLMYYDSLESVLLTCSGPFVCDSVFSLADALIYCLVQDSEADIPLPLDKWPRLKQLVQAVETAEGASGFIDTRRWGWMDMVVEACT